MRIAFYAPFKPLDHPTPSGDLMIARGLYQSLQQQGHQPLIVSRLRCRWIYWNPCRQLDAAREIRRLSRLLTREPVDCWLTYHCYYKSPDILGPILSRRLGLPYVIFQGSYASKYRRQGHTLPGYLLARRALSQAQLHISDRGHDLVNLARLIPKERLRYVRPGIVPRHFSFDPRARAAMRSRWRSGRRPVICTAAMFRADVKSQGIAWVIDCCQELHRQGLDFQLVIAGDGPQGETLQRHARRLPGEKVLFTGAIQREQLYRFYSAGDLFAFPGFQESLGMVFLEAQSCGLPVVACRNGGIPEVVAEGRTGLLSALDDRDAFCTNLATLLRDPEHRRAMGQAAARHIRHHHDREHNYRHIGRLLQEVVHTHGRRSGAGNQP
ncbi:glycosyltransferase family 4 protein [Desulfogranum mediterraneum]|uniref:glycosyltransferase family 4 protein n=1 Tax=Desulfogranum mediterraneum TaxID=160661 RepID=UPI0003FCA8E7|nr:glycosyltransferase family 4 protein [Desulfogranum mediterraneum]